MPIVLRLLVEMFLSHVWERICLRAVLRDDRRRELFYVFVEH